MKGLFSFLFAVIGLAIDISTVSDDDARSTTSQVQETAQYYAATESNSYLLTVEKMLTKQMLFHLAVVPYLVVLLVPDRTDQILQITLRVDMANSERSEKNPVKVEGEKQNN